MKEIKAIIQPFMQETTKVSHRRCLLKTRDAGSIPAAASAAQTLRKLYATPWNPWTLVETLDNKLGAISRKTLKWRHDVLPS